MARSPAEPTTLDLQVWGPDALTLERLQSHGEAAFGKPVEVLRQNGIHCLSPTYRMLMRAQEDTPEARQRLLRFLHDDDALPPTDVL